MKIEIKGYTDQYKQGVLQCLKNNYSWMARVSDEALYKWAEPFMAYEWKEELPEAVKPYQHGIVFLDGQQVVGFLGFIYARRHWNGHEYIYQNGTTWAVNRGYRIYLFKALKKADAVADVLGDFTPVKAVEETLTKVFKYKYIDRSVYRFYPVPRFSRESLTYQMIENGNALPDEILRTEYEDHKPYGVKCLRVSDGHSDSFIFFRVNHRVRKNRKIFRKRRSILKILKLTNPDLFCSHYIEIVWHMQKKGHPYVQLEPRFIAPHRLEGFGIKRKKVVRLGLNKTDEDITVDLLYSEEALLP
ncbi:MAG: hypothetical protein DBY44_07040 [Veillonellaceae bacterium]|nr:MAG: hypothetical protein DBY44_07040 [Veillonellaceae bacterium]